jgi:hypothetical protein
LLQLAKFATHVFVFLVDPLRILKGNCSCTITDTKSVKRKFTVVVVLVFTKLFLEIQQGCLLALCCLVASSKLKQATNSLAVLGSTAPNVTSNGT